MPTTRSRTPPGQAFERRRLRSAGGQGARLVDDQYALYNDELMPRSRRGASRSPTTATATRRSDAGSTVFRAQVRPLLIPVGLDPAHPFPQVANKSLNFIVRLGGRDAFGRENTIAIVKVPRVLPRVIKMPARGREQSFVSLSSVIRAHLGDLFPGREVESFSQFRVTRHSDLAVDDDVRNLRTALRPGLEHRHFGQAVRLEVVRSCPKSFRVSAAAVQPAAGGAVPGARAGQPGAPERPDRPRREDYNCASAVLRLLAVDPGAAAVVVRPPARLRRADSPAVREVRRRWWRSCARPSTIRRCWRSSRRSTAPAQVAADGAAARGGAKRQGSDGVVELKARFDEEANINWAERLEAVGAQVVYGVVGLKTHAKLLLVTRREAGRLRRYVHLSTGNYNPNTARIYTDIGHFTADPALTADADAVFQHLASLGRTRGMRAMLQAPFTLHKQMLAELARVAAAAAAGQPARVVVKINALTDTALIGALVGTAGAGAEIDLIVRGACMLPPGVAGATDRCGCARSSAASSSTRGSPISAGARATPTRRCTSRAPTGWAATCSAGSRWRGRCAQPAAAPAGHRRVPGAVPARPARTPGRCRPTAATVASQSAGPSAQQALVERYAAREGRSSRQAVVMDLILWRHAEAVEGQPDEDLARALTAKGERQAAADGRVAQPPPRPLDPRCSSARRVRCQQTAKALGRPFRTVAPLAPGAGAPRCSPRPAGRRDGGGARRRPPADARPGRVSRSPAVPQRLVGAQGRRLVAALGRTATRRGPAAGGAVARCLTAGGALRAGPRAPASGRRRRAAARHPAHASTSSRAGEARADAPRPSRREGERRLRRRCAASDSPPARPRRGRGRR